MEVIEDWHGKKSTIIVSQLPPAGWFDVISETTIADAILDRLVHASIIIGLEGESSRKNGYIVSYHLFIGIKPSEDQNDRLEGAI
jgi:DNA replication protein DnaC